MGRKRDPPQGAALAATGSLAGPATDGKFSHSGVDAFSLVRDETGWRIVGILYTVEPDPDACLEDLGPPL